eukprot:407107_1
MMAEGDGNSAAIAAVDSSDVFNPKQTCRNCGTSNDISITICKECGKDVYGTDKTGIEIEDTSAMLNDSNKRKSLGKVFFDKKIAAPAPTSSEELVVVQNEGMMDIEHIEDFLDDDLIDEGRKDRNNNNNNQQNINANANNISGNRPLFTTILVIYWLYYLVWFVVGIILTFFSWIGVNEGITTICMMLPSLIMLVLMSRISCLNSVNINNINHFWNLPENQKQKYKLTSILITTLLLFGALLRAIWWIYCIVEYVSSNNYVSSNRLSITLVSLLINEFGIIILINIDYLKMAYFERNRNKQGIFGIVNNPYPCLISLSILVTIQLWILSYGSLLYKPDSDICNWWIAYIFECGLHVIYVITAIITIIIPILYAIKIYINAKNENENNNNNNRNGFDKLTKIEQYVVIGILASLMLLTFIMALSIFAGFQEAYTWIHLLLLPQLFGIMWALYKLRKLSQS